MLLIVGLCILISETHISGMCQLPGRIRENYFSVFCQEAF